MKNADEIIFSQETFTKVTTNLLDRDFSLLAIYTGLSIEREMLKRCVIDAYPDLDLDGLDKYVSDTVDGKELANEGEKKDE